MTLQQILYPALILFIVALALYFQFRGGDSHE